MKNQVLQRPTQEDIGSTKKNQPVQFNPPPHSLSTCRVLCGFRVWKFLRADFLRFYLFKFSSYPPSTLLCTSPPLYSCDVRLVHSKPPTPTPSLPYYIRAEDFPLIWLWQRSTRTTTFHFTEYWTTHIFVFRMREPQSSGGPAPHTRVLFMQDIFTSIAFHRGTHLVLLLLVYVKSEERQISHYDCIDRSIANKPSNPPSHAFN